MLVILALFSGLVAKIALPTLAAILIFAAIGILLTLIGAYIGERIQLGPPPKTAE